jgi:hypothetical protein
MGHLRTSAVNISLTETVLGVVAIWLMYALVVSLFSPLRKVPGPFWARFSRAWYLRKVWQGDFEKTNLKLHEKYGKRQWTQSTSTSGTDFLLIVNQQALSCE